MSNEYEMKALRDTLAETQRALWNLQSAVERLTAMTSRLVEHAERSELAELESKEKSRG